MDFVTTNTPDFATVAQPVSELHALAADQRAAFAGARTQAVLQALPNPIYSNAFEIGCGRGALTRKLAGRCARLLAADSTGEAVRETVQRTAAFPHVTVRRMRAPNELPDERFDLIVLSGFLGLLDSKDLERMSAYVSTALRPGGHCVLAHWLGASTTDGAADRFIREAGDDLQLMLRHRPPHFRIDLLERA